MMGQRQSDRLDVERRMRQTHNRLEHVYSTLTTDAWISDERLRWSDVTLYLLPVTLRLGWETLYSGSKPQ